MSSRYERNRMMDRRKFLLSAGATAATLPYLRALPSYAQGGQSKLVLVFSGNGRIRHLWGADDSTGELVFRQNLAPLQPYAQHITVTEGLRNFGAAEIGGTHEGGTMSLFTGAGGGLGLEAANVGFPSIDTLFMAQQTGTARSDSFYQQVVAERNSAENAGPNNRIAFDANGDRRDPYRSGWEAVDQYLAGVISSTGSTEDTGPQPKDIARTALFENLNAQLGELESKLCSDDYYQMQAMREAVAQASGSMQRMVNCELPELPARPDLPEWEPIWQPPQATINLDSTDDWYYQRARLAIDLLVLSLACGVTNSAVLQFDQGAGEAFAEGMAQHHHNTSHGVPQLGQFLVGYMGTTAQDSSVGPDYLQGDPNETDQYAYYTLDYQNNPTPALIQQFQPVWDDLSKFELFYAEQFAYLVGQMEQFGLLDDTAILWGSELDDGQHKHHNMPLLLASGANLPFPRGKVMRYPMSFDQEDTRWLGEPQGPVRSHADLLQTVLAGVGVNVPNVGVAQHNTGILEDFLV